MKIPLLLLSIIFANGLLFVNMYTSIVDAKSWGANIPDSIIAARDYAKKYNPGTFFRKFSPVNQILALLVVIVCWSVPTVRLYAGIAFVMYVLAEGMTFLYFFPRNEILFKTTPLPDLPVLRKAWQDWSRMNWFRSFIQLIGLCFSLMAMYELCKDKF